MTTKRWTAFLVPLLASMALGGCGRGDGGDEYTEAIPDPEMLSLAIEEGGSVSSGLSVEGALSSPEGIRDGASATADWVDRLVETTHDSLGWVVTHGVVTDFRNGLQPCRSWEASTDRAQWRLVGCVKDRVTRLVGFALVGRPAGSTAEKDWAAVLAGEARALPRFDGKRRGAGVIGYNFDHYAALTGAQVSGRLGMGYRAAGRARQIVLGLDGVEGRDSTQPLTGVFRYTHVVGLGGRFAFTRYGDFLATDPASGIVMGQDGVNELGRAVLGWRTDGRARTVLAACGGTLGAGQCRRIAQCWTTDSQIGFQRMFEDSTPIAWDEAQCADLAVDLGEPPAPDEVAPPEATDPETGAPAVEPPAAIPGE